MQRSTLVLAYVGATLPLLLVLRTTGVALPDALNTQGIAEPVIATLLGSTAPPRLRPAHHRARPPRHRPERYRPPAARTTTDLRREARPAPVRATAYLTVPSMLRSRFARRKRA